VLPQEKREKQGRGSSQQGVGKAGRQSDRFALQKPSASEERVSPDFSAPYFLLAYSLLLQDAILTLGKESLLFGGNEAHQAVDGVRSGALPAVVMPHL
jgi:hypothetical protein